MPIDGGRLNAHKARTEDFRRRKDGTIKGSDKQRFTSNEKIDFGAIDPAALKEVRIAIRKKAKKRRAIEIFLIVISMVIAVILFILFTGKYS